MVATSETPTRLGRDPKKGWPKNPKHPVYMVNQHQFMRRFASPESYGIGRYATFYYQKNYDYHDVWLLNKRELLELLKRANAYVLSAKPARIWRGKNFISVDLVPASNRRDYSAAFEGLSRMTLTKWHSSAHDWRGDAEYFMYQFLAARILAPVLKNDIAISVPHRRSSRYHEDFTAPFQIKIWSSPTDDYSVDTPSSMWGYRVSCRDRSFKSSGRGVPIVDDRGHEVAELFPCALFIHHDLVENSDVDALCIFRKILEAVVEHAKKYGSPRQWALMQQRELEARAEEDYSKACIEAVGDVRLSVDDDVRRADYRVDELTRMLNNAIVTHEQLQTRQRVLSTFEQDSTRFADDIKVVKKLPQVASVFVQRGWLYIKTKRLLCQSTSTGEQHRLGVVYIMINLKDGSVRVRQIPNHDSEETVRLPHVRSNGELVWGQYQLDVISYLARFEVSTVVDFVLQLLAQITPEEVGFRNLSYYSVVQESDAEAQVAA